MSRHDLGPFVGPITRDDAFAALDQCTKAVLVYIEVAGQIVLSTGGSSVDRAEGDPLFAIGGTPDAREFEAGRYTLTNWNALLALPDPFRGEQHAFGFACHLAEDVKLVVQWHDEVSHLTDDGDVAPGFGPIREGA